MQSQYAHDHPGDDELPTTRASGAHIRVDPVRLRAALEMLATGDSGDSPRVLLGFIQLMMARACVSPTGFESWLDGALVVSIRPRPPRGVELHVGGDSGRGLEQAFSVPFARLSLASVSEAIDREPALVGPAFVHVEDGELSISVLTYVDAPAEPEWVDADDLTVVDFDLSSRTRAHAPTLCFESEPESEHDDFDPDLTVVSSPSSELIRLSRAAETMRRRR